jgi:hypothetical protein
MPYLLSNFCTIDHHSRNQQPLNPMPNKKQTERIYLTEDEKKILRPLVEAWVGQPDKKSRDAFVAAEALPKIQEINVSKFSPDIISRDKAAKLLWEKRIQVRLLKYLFFTTF